MSTLQPPRQAWGEEDPCTAPRRACVTSPQDASALPKIRRKRKERQETESLLRDFLTNQIEGQNLTVHYN